MYYGSPSFTDIREFLGKRLLEAPEVRVPEWQSLDVKDKPQGVTHELRNVVITTAIPTEWDGADLINNWGVNLPWAEKQFNERVSGIPLNPPPSASTWPFAQAGHKDHLKEEKFSHTYPERMWPKFPCQSPAWSRAVQEHYHARRGIRFAYGDLKDVVNQLTNSPLTRQAYLPIWFPEDTGAVHGERVPCSLGYHFLIREGKVHVTYFIRSVDFLRHFPDDVFMAMRLGQWMKEEFNAYHASRPAHGSEDFIEAGDLTMHMVSLHVFGGDMPKMRRTYG